MTSSWRVRIIFLLALYSLNGSITWADQPQVSGSIKSLNLYGEAAPDRLFPSYKASSNRLRIDLDWSLDEQIHFEAALDHQLLWTDPPGLVPLAGDGQNRRIDMDKTWSHSDDWSNRLQVDRLNLRWQGSRVDVVIGRQPIGFGRILIFSPLDAVAPFAPDAIDTDIRIGIDALRLTSHYGLDGQVGGIVVWGDEVRHNSYLATWTDNRSGLDLLAIGGRLRDRSMIGFGLAGSLGHLGLKGEISLYNGQDVGEPKGDLYDRFTIGALEAWYRFDNGLTLVTQYLYNGPGVSDPKDYLEVLASAPINEGLTYLLGRHYLMFAPSYELHPLASLQGLVIWNLEDDSVLLRPTFALDLTDDLSLELFWSLHEGESPSEVTPLQPSLPRSEFGMRGDSGGLFVKYFF